MALSKSQISVNFFDVSDLIHYTHFDIAQYCDELWTDKFLSLYMSNYKFGECESEKYIDIKLPLDSVRLKELCSMKHG